MIPVVHHDRKAVLSQARQDIAVKHKTDLVFDMCQELVSFCTVGFIFIYIHMESYCVKLSYATQHTKMCEKVYCAG